MYGLQYVGGRAVGEHGHDAQGGGWAVCGGSVGIEVLREDSPGAQVGRCGRECGRRKRGSGVSVGVEVGCCRHTGKKDVCKTVSSECWTHELQQACPHVS